ncbi:MAG TPA: DnaB-like helicase C-terminal domain-containing protein [Terriglobales bacterium]|nr:DnaB-like helicase C-terminal domain-containing protein [Terriglobales bacterium]
MSTLDYIDRALPTNLEAERSVLGAILLDAKAYDEAAALGLAAGELSLDSHRRIYLAMQAIADTGRPIDLVTLSEELSSHRQLEAVGDYGYISGLLDGVPDRPSIRHYVRIVREKAMQRRLVHACHSTIGVIGDGCSSQQAIEALGENILQIQTGSDDAPAQRVVSFTDQVYNEWEKLADGSGDLIGLTTSLDCLDLATTGIRKGELWLVGGRTGDGKTALSLQIAAANCRNEIPVAIFSIEMGQGDLLQRLWSHDGKIPFQCIRYPRRLEPEMRTRIRLAMGDVGQWPLFVVEDSSLSIQKLIAKARLLIRREKVQLLIVDYVQLISVPARDEKERLTKVSNALRALAKDTGVPVVAISQLSRPKDGSLNARPNKFHLKESGSQENDAHVIILTYRPVDEFGNPSGEDELIIAKQRHGPVSNELVYFDSKTLTFHERTNR